MKQRRSKKAWGRYQGKRYPYESPKGTAWVRRQRQIKAGRLTVANGLKQ